MNNILNIILVVISTFHSPKALVRRSSGRRISPRSLNHDCVVFFVLIDTNEEIKYFRPIVLLRSNSLFEQVHIPRNTQGHHGALPFSHDRPKILKISHCIRFCQIKARRTNKNTQRI